MPPVAKHCQISQARRGREFRELHEWIDNDPRHKATRHDLSQVLTLAEAADNLFGPEAGRELLQHLLDDLKAKLGHALPDAQPVVAQTLAQLGIK